MPEQYDEAGETYSEADPEPYEASPAQFDYSTDSEDYYPEAATPVYDDPEVYEVAGAGDDTPLANHYLETEDQYARGFDEIPAGNDYLDLADSSGDTSFDYTDSTAGDASDAFNVGGFSSAPALNYNSVFPGDASDAPDSRGFGAAIFGDESLLPNFLTDATDFATDLLGFSGAGDDSAFVPNGVPPLLDSETDSPVVGNVPPLFGVEPDALIASSSSPAPAKAADLSFTGRVNSNFNAWDDDHDGHLEKSEIFDAMHDKNIKGDDAAALAALRINMDKIDDLNKDGWFGAWDSDGVSRDDLKAYQGLDAKNALRASGEGEYGAARSKINGLTDADRNRPLFGADNPSTKDKNESLPDDEAMRQGRAGDCSVLAATGSIAAQDPERLKGMYTENKDGSTTVHLASGDQKVEALTDAERAYYGSSGANGQWQSLMEKAYDQFKGGTSGDGNPIETVISNYAGPAASVTMEGQNLDTARDNLKDAMRDNRVVTAAVYENEDEQKNGGTVLPDGHAYAVTDYNEKTDTVTVRNPWGSNANGEPKAADGKPRDGKDDGQFTMSMKEFNETFDQMSYEKKK